jgi:hypothetical protein
LDFLIEHSVAVIPVYILGNPAANTVITMCCCVPTLDTIFYSLAFETGVVRCKKLSQNSGFKDNQNRINSNSILPLV